VDINKGREIHGLERAQRLLMGISQTIMTGVGIGKALDSLGEAGAEAGAKGAGAAGESATGSKAVESAPKSTSGPAVADAPKPLSNEPTITKPAPVETSAVEPPATEVPKAKPATPPAEPVAVPQEVKAPEAPAAAPATPAVEKTPPAPHETPPAERPAAKPTEQSPTERQSNSAKPEDTSPTGGRPVIDRNKMGVGAANANDELFSANRTYEAGGGARPKHGREAYARGGEEVSPAPKNGQTALDNSVQIKDTSTRRIGVDPETNEIVILDRTGSLPNGAGGSYHGHVKTWKKLSPELKKLLTKEGMTDKKGNIIRQRFTDAEGRPLGKK
jgi:hypothetical protein